MSFQWNKNSTTSSTKYVCRGTFDNLPLEKNVGYTVWLGSPVGTRRSVSSEEEHSTERQSGVEEYINRVPQNAEDRLFANRKTDFGFRIVNRLF